MQIEVGMKATQCILCPGQDVVVVSLKGHF